MTNLLFFFSELTAGELRVLIGLAFIFRLLSSAPMKRKHILTGALAALLFAALLSLTKVSLLYRIGFEAAFTALLAVRILKTPPRLSLFISIFYEIACFFWQFLLGAALGILFRSPAYLEPASTEGLSALWLFSILFVTLSVCILKKQALSGSDAFRLTSAISVLGFISVITLSQQDILVLAEDTLTMWTILSIILLMSILVFRLNRQYETEKELARLKAQEALLLERDYTALNRTYAVHAKLFHDLHNHIGILQQLLTHENYREALQYLDNLQQPVKELTNTAWTGDAATDYLINSKAAAASAREIAFHAQVEFPRHTNIQSADLCAILGNFLDNALEAAAKLSSPKERFIRLTIRRINHMLIIKVENSFFTAPIQENGQLKTTKTEGGLHGWGLKSAQTAAEKYDGTVQTSCEESIFRAVATLSYSGINSIDGQKPTD